MGKFHNGVLGTMTGKVGGVVGRTWKGINTVASYQPNVSNPRTNSQMAQRGKLSALTALASQMNTGFIKPLWDRDAKKMSGFNAFIQANMANVSNLGVVDYANLVASKGKMAAPLISGLNAGMEKLDVAYATTVNDAYGLPSDKVYCAVIDTVTNAVYVSSGVAARSEGTLSFDIPDANESEFYVFLAFRRADGSMVSNSAAQSV